jgi:hypothetical protein
MTQVPAVIPFTMPVPSPTVAMPGHAQLHVPPKVPWLNVELVPTHRFIVPVGAGGAALTVTTAVVAHPTLTV